MFSKQTTCSCCTCFGLLKKSKTQTQKPVTKPQGLFGSLSYKEVCHKIAEKDNYGGLTRRENFGLISCIVKSGDDLKQEQFASQMM